ncbi:mandelate racemase/muconate lactonizing enzyme family protein [Virgibacillus halodenitrificans]|uniref:mandelate racemase/muconate lactonizing enzyme family protein n=1 Tax=Virgibacillus halodenitrificans TaxID=1482 RepID=UPI00045C762F|nr:dipeptide epimerase [Virgibacillus halodenitrificans]MCJ0930465.1 dipeptide epimerase [Virgibacillus halodenitrificans]MEC2158796.1 dipeptide epimerase [Virgibacillus halodenitrificans]CDQ32488.1 L-Ala-D/L-Glu epimerase [Virgibacillus halodenitrificans]
MKIHSIEVFVVEFPLIEPFVISYASYDSMPSVIVKLTTEDGWVGYGEGVADEHVTGESVESVFQIITKTLAPQLIGQNPMNLEKIHDVMNKAILGAPTAKAAIDIACYDVVGKALHVPAYVLLGGRYHEKFPITHVLSIDTPEKMAASAEDRVAKGYTSFKMKVGYDVADDVARIKAVSDRVGNKAAIRVDVNQGWQSAAKTLQALDALKNVALDWLEQPVVAEDIDALAEVKAKSSTPIMADEALVGFKQMREIIAKRAADKVNIKLMKCGGMYPAAKLAAMAEMAGIDCQVGSMVESSVGSAAGFHVAFSKKAISSVELTGPLKFSKDIGNLHYDVPFIQLNEKAGLGVDVNEDILHALTVYSKEVK